jgi:hypothetical protein
VLPAVRVVKDTGAVRETVTVQVTGLSATPVVATVGIALANQSSASPGQDVSVSLGEQRSVAFNVTLPRDADSLTVNAFARVGGREWRDEVSVIAHRELEPAYLYAVPVTRLRRVPLALAPGAGGGAPRGVHHGRG